MNPAIPDLATSRLAKSGTKFGFDSDGTLVTQAGIDFGFAGRSIYKSDLVDDICVRINLHCFSIICTPLFLLLKTSGKLRLNFLNGRQNGFQVVRQGPGQFVFRDADGFVQFPLAERFVQGQEIKDIGIFQGGFGELRMRFLQSHIEIGDRRALAFVSMGLDHGGECVATPPLGDRLPGIPKAGGQIL